MASAKKETKKEVKVVVKKGDKRQVSSERIDKAEASTKRFHIEYREPFYDFFGTDMAKCNKQQSTIIHLWRKQNPLWHQQKMFQKVSLALLFSCLGIHLDWRKKTWGRTQGLTKGTDPLRISDLDIEWREKKGED